MSSSRSESSFAGTNLRLALLSSTMIAVAMPLAAQAQTVSSGAEQSARAQTGLIQFNVPPQELDSALTRVADQGGIRIFFTSGELAGLRSNGVSGAMSVEQALSQVLTGTGFGWRYREARTVVIEKLPQTSTGTIQLGPVRVEGSGGASGSDFASITSDPAATEGKHSYTAAGPSNTATGLPLTLRETPQSVTVVTRQKMDDFALETLTDVLEQTPGITVRRNGTNVHFASRGASDVNLQIDGLRQIRTGWMYLANSLYVQDDMAEIDRIEVLKGSSGLINGDGSYGATINLIRKKPTREFQASFGAGAASWNSYRFDADVGGPLNQDGTLRARVVAAWKDGDSFRNYETSKYHMFYGTVDFEPTSNTLINVGLTYKHSEHRGQTNNDSIPAHGNDGQAIPFLPRSFNRGAPWAGYKENALSAFGTITQRLGGEWTAKIQVAQETVKRPEMLLATIYPPPDPVAFVSSYKNIRQRNENLAIDLQGPVNLFGRKHDLLIGAGTSRSRTELSRGPSPWPYATAAQMGITFADGGVAIPYPDDRSSWTFYPEFFSSKRQYVYAAGRFNIADPLKIIVGVRVSDFDAYDVTADWWQTNQRERSVVTPYAGLIVDVSRDVSLYASYASVFRPQSTRDANGRVLNPEEGQTYEIGAKGEFFGGRLNASANHFWMKTDNTAEATGELVTGTVSERAYRAVMGATRRGFEIELSGEVTSGWQAQGSFVLNDSSLNTADQVPKHQFKLNTSYRLSEGPLTGLIVGGGARWQSRIIAGTAPLTVEQPPFWLFDLIARYEIGDNLTLGINIDNILDKKYFSGLWLGRPMAYYSWGEPRSFKASARYRF